MANKAMVRIFKSFGFSTSFISITKKAKKYDLGNKAVHMRNMALVEIHREFMDAVNKGRYKPNQFKSFLDDKQKG